MEKTPPLVTLVVPTLNRPRYLREALGCVLAQDYPNLEILISDNGSHDDTPALARALASGDPRVRFRRNAVTVPVYEHFTQCVQAARGTFFVLVCDDDRINPGFVSELVGVTMRHPGVNVALPACVTIDEQGALLETFAVPEGEVLDGVEFACHWMYERRPVYFNCLATTLMRTEVIRRFGGYQPFARGLNIDNLMFLQGALTGPVGFAHRAIFNWRIYNHSYGTTADPKQIAKSAWQLVDHLRHDPLTVEALAALPAARRKEVIDGARIMGAKSFLYYINFYNDPYASFRQVFGYHPDVTFLRLVLRHYVWWTRRRLLRRHQEVPAEVSGSPASLTHD
jgi:glycosyltransferase involved in cell wall biosynthesis